MNRLIRSVLLVAFLLLAMAARAQKITFTPQWTAQSQFAGYYVAQEMGYYKEAGLEVEIVHPSASMSAINLIRSGKSQITTLQLCQAMQIIDEGLPLVNILQTSMNNALVIVSRKDENPIEQKGIRVGTWSVGFDQIAFCMSLKEQLDYKWIPVASNSTLLVSGAIDATLAMSYNEYYLLKQSGVRLTDKNVYRFCDHDYNVQEDGVYMIRKYYEEHRDDARRFAEASRRGWEWAVEHPEETIDIVMRYVTEGEVVTNRPLQRLQLKEILRLQVDRESGKREFRLRPDMVSLANSLMTEGQMLFNEVTYEDLVSE
ncbi:MAG: ABC transporter substrate-binding protein [Bacteroidales bacterium]|nr:ABC transporter substrate-binding protein [Bacteroidales bacterium]